LNEDNTRSIEKFCSENEIDVVGLVPFDLTVTKAMVDGKPIVEFDSESPASKALREMWIRVYSLLCVHA
jgi:MinD superfamily P-loop ATPase